MDRFGFPTDNVGHALRRTTGGGGQDYTPKSIVNLIVKMLDPSTSQILWTGQISELKMNAIEPQKEFQKAAWRLLAEFPPLTN